MAEILVQFPKQISSSQTSAIVWHCKMHSNCWRKRSLKVNSHVGEEAVNEIIDLHCKHAAPTSQFVYIVNCSAQTEALGIFQVYCKSSTCNSADKIADSCSFVSKTAIHHCALLIASVVPICQELAQFRSAFITSNEMQEMT